MDNEEGRNILVPVDDAEVRVPHSQELDWVQYLVMNYQAASLLAACVFIHCHDFVFSCIRRDFD